MPLHAKSVLLQNLYLVYILKINNIISVHSYLPCVVRIVQQYRALKGRVIRLTFIVYDVVPARY